MSIACLRKISLTLIWDPRVLRLGSQHFLWDPNAAHILEKFIACSHEIPDTMNGIPWKCKRDPVKIRTGSQRIFDRVPLSKQNGISALYGWDPSDRWMGSQMNYFGTPRVRARDSKNI